ncbi:MAG: RimK/LysX family protein [Cyanobacteriota bacterium]|nr:RimK/LysX family protein [Cyanobacteriota bacterium]
MKIILDRLASTISSKKFFVAIFIGLLSGAGCTAQKIQATGVKSFEPQIVGWIEKGKIAGIEEEVKVKLDTGATTTSINAEILEQPDEETESGGMIKFRFSNEEGVSKIYELPVTRWVKIESRTQDYIRRPVVQMKMCLAGRWVEEEVNLADRSNFNYSVLVGRNMLSKSKLVIDSSATFTKTPSCEIEEAE